MQSLNLQCEQLHFRHSGMFRNGFNASQQSNSDDRTILNMVYVTWRLLIHAIMGYFKLPRVCFLLTGIGVMHSSERLPENNNPKNCMDDLKKK